MVAWLLVWTCVGWWLLIVLAWAFARVADDGRRSRDRQGGRRPVRSTESEDSRAP